MRLMILAALVFPLTGLASAQSFDDYQPGMTVVTEAHAGLPGPRSVRGALLHDNGSFITSTGDGPGGSDVSLLQQGSLGLTNFGLGIQAGQNHRVADDFSVPAGQLWTIDTIVFFGYQTGSGTAASTIDQVNVRIWRGSPADPGSAVVFGDITTNRFDSSTWTGVYRFSDMTPNDTARPVMEVVATLPAVQLPPGTYWLDWSFGGTLASGPWQPPITVIGQATTGNALRFATTTSGLWVPYEDNGTLTQQGVPFQLSGSSRPYVVTTPPQFIPSAGTWALLLLGGLVLLIAVRRSHAQG